MDGREVSTSRHIQQVEYRKGKKGILDLKCEVLGHFIGDAKQTFVSRAEEENYELDMYIFGRHQYRSNTDDKRMDEGSQEKANTRRKKITHKLLSPSRTV